MTDQTLIDFRQTQDQQLWQIVNDQVMGGRSVGNFHSQPEGLGVFSGQVSLANNGGFTWAKTNWQEPVDCRAYTNLSLQIKGDGKDYQIRVKSDSHQSHSYRYIFHTSGAWETIDIPLNEMEPIFRGRKLNESNFPGLYIQELGFLIANGRAERFHLQIQKIVLKS